MGEVVECPDLLWRVEIKSKSMNPMGGIGGWGGGNGWGTMYTVAHCTVYKRMSSHLRTYIRVMNALLNCLISGQGVHFIEVHGAKIFCF